MVRTNIQGPFIQIPSKDLSHGLELVPVWYVQVPAKDLSGILATLKKELPQEAIDLAHIRRVVKLEEQGTVMLKLMVATQDCISKPDLQNVLPEQTIHEATVSKWQADTKDEAAEWSEKSGWPIMWRGNPSQAPPVLSAEEQEAMLKWVHALGTAKNKTIIVDPKTQEIVAEEVQRTDLHPLDHSIMRTTRTVAGRDLARKQADPAASAYLCVGLDVYTTDEPCTMCGMALVHSRIGRLIYLNPSPSTGSIDPSNQLGYGLHGRRQLNHTFEAWQYKP